MEANGITEAKLAQVLRRTENGPTRRCIYCMDDPRVKGILFGPLMEDAKDYLPSVFREVGVSTSWSQLIILN